MSRDLEETLNELGPEYRAVVARLRGARVRETSDGRRGFASGVFRLRSNVLRPVLAAASLLVFVGIGVVFFGRNDIGPETGDAGYGAREYRATVGEMVATQNPDGSWKSDFLTRRNAAALRVCGDPAAQVAYRKAVRNLRMRGLL